MKRAFILVRFASDHGRRAVAIGVLAVTALAAVLRFVQLGSESLWIDEGATWRLAQMTHARLWGPEAVYETNPPLWYSLERLMLWFGDSETVLRLLPALLGTATVPLVFLIGRRVGGAGVGLLAAALLATSTTHLTYSQEARGYALLVAGAMLAVWGMLELLTAHAPLGPEPASDAPVPRRRTWLAGVSYALGTTLAIYAHNTGILLPVLTNLAALAWWLGPARRDRGLAWLWIAANLVPFAAWLFWAPTVLLQLREASNIGWIRQPSLPGAVAGVAKMYGLPYLPGIGWQLASAVPAALLMALGAWRLRQRPALLAVLLALVAGLPALVWTAGLVARPLWIERTVLWPLGIGCVLIALGVLALPRPALRLAVVGGLLALQLVNAAGYYRAERKAPWDRLVADVATAYAPGDAFVLVPHLGHWVFAYYAARHDLPHADLGAWLEVAVPDGYPRIEPADRGVVRFDLQRVGEHAAAYRRLWVGLWRERTLDPDGWTRAALARLGALEAERAYGEELTLLRVRVAPASSVSRPAPSPGS